MSTEEAKQLIQELKRVRKQTRYFHLLTIIALLVIVVSGVSAVIESLYSLTLSTTKREAFVSSLSEDAQKNLLPAVQKIAGRSLEHLQPAVETEMKKLNARAPEVADAALREIEQMGNELPARATEIFDQTITSAVQKRDTKLRAMYPDIYDQRVEILLNNLALEAQDQFGRSGENLFNSHLNSIQNILADLETIQKTEPVDASESVDAWQVAYMFMDVFVHEFTNTNTSASVELKSGEPPGVNLNNANPATTTAMTK